MAFALGDLEFHWDPEKAAANAKKHGITFEEAATTWLDPFAIERPDPEHSVDEELWLRIAASLRGALLVAWSTEKENDGRIVIRIIGARRATAGEHDLYESSRRDSSR